jgi:hypothetical protein
MHLPLARRSLARPDQPARPAFEPEGRQRRALGATRAVRSPRARVTGLLAILAFAAVAGCAGAPAPSIPGSQFSGAPNDPRANGSAAPSGSLDPRDAGIAFARCMRANGIEIADPGSGSTTQAATVDKDSPAFDAAFAACQGLLQAAAPSEDPAADRAWLDRRVTYARCMRSHGIDMPDPVVASSTGSDEGGWTSSTAPGFDIRSTAFRDADAACGGLNAGKLDDPGEAAPGPSAGNQP